MREQDLDEVLVIENASYPTPWRREHFQYEIHEHPYAHCIVAWSGDVRAAFACVWIIDRELRINNITVRPDLRCRGVGRAVMEYLIETARRGGCEIATLEVRPSNRPARRLYARLGFREFGRRKGYYADTGEDALLLRLRLDSTGGEDVDRSGGPEI